MIHLHFARDLSVPPALAWPWLTSPEQISTWASVRMSRATPGPTGSHDEAGAIRTVHMRAGPIPMRMEERLVEIQPPRRLVYRTRGWGHRQHQGTILLTPRGDATHLQWTVQLAPRIPGTERWLRGLLEGQFEADLDALELRLATLSGA